MPETEPPNVAKNGESNQGKSVYFDPAEPRREVLLNPNGSLCKWGSRVHQPDERVLPELVPERELRTDMGRADAARHALVPGHRRPAGAGHRRQGDLRRPRRRLDRRRHGPRARLRRLGQRRDRPARTDRHRGRPQRTAGMPTSTAATARPRGRASPSAARARTSCSRAPAATG